MGRAFKPTVVTEFNREREILLKGKWDKHEITKREAIELTDLHIMGFKDVIRIKQMSLTALNDQIEQIKVSKVEKEKQKEILCKPIEEDIKKIETLIELQRVGRREILKYTKFEWDEVMNNLIAGELWEKVHGQKEYGIFHTIRYHMKNTKRNLNVLEKQSLTMEQDQYVRHVCDLMAVQASLTSALMNSISDGGSSGDFMERNEYINEKTDRGIADMQSAKRQWEIIIKEAEQKEAGKDD